MSFICIKCIFYSYQVRLTAYKILIHDIDIYVCIRFVYSDQTRLFVPYSFTRFKFIYSYQIGSFVYSYQFFLFIRIKISVQLFHCPIRSGFTLKSTEETCCLFIYRIKVRLCLFSAMWPRMGTALYKNLEYCLFIQNLTFGGRGVMNSVMSRIWLKINCGVKQCKSVLNSSIVIDYKFLYWYFIPKNYWI